MNSSFEAMLVLEHHRALYRFNNARTEEDRVRYELEAKRAEHNLDEFVKEANGSRVQRVKEADNTREAIPTMCLMRKADNERR